MWGVGGYPYPFPINQRSQAQQKTDTTTGGNKASTPHPHANSGEKVATQNGTTDKYQKAELRYGSRTCECASCLRFFTSVSAFDMHQGFANPKVEDWNTLRCKTEAEMLAIGMVPNPYGVWATGKKLGFKK